MTPVPRRIAEKMYGVASSLDNFVYLFMGYGLGAGIVIQGEIYAGMAGNAVKSGGCRPPAAVMRRRRDHSKNMSRSCRSAASWRWIQRTDLFEQLQSLSDRRDKKLLQWAKQAGVHLKQAMQLSKKDVRSADRRVGRPVASCLAGRRASHMEPFLPSVFGAA